ncbi:hypothetical protein OT109_07355 [Phycisphaeraceae bacterium D3-23]
MHKFLTAALATGLLASPFAVHADEDEPIDFVIEDGKVIPTEDFAVMVSVLGAALTNGAGGNDVPVTAEVRIGGDIILHPWGDAASLDGDINTHGPTRHHIVREQFLAEDGLEITFTGRSFLPNGDVMMEVNSHDEGVQVIVLRDGDDAPSLAGFGDQDDAEAFVAPYIDYDTGKMTMDQNQAIYLFELGTSDVDSAAADFQDLVVLVTLGEEPRDFYQYTDLEALYD